MSSTQVQPVILAGGSGTRLWPLSRERHPKQFLPLLGPRTLFQETANRLDGMQGVSAPIVVCNEVHRFLVLDQMRELEKAPLVTIVEPEGRNTAPALTLAALWISHFEGLAKRDPVMLVMPSDPLIRDKTGLQRAVDAGRPIAAAGNIVTFGVVPEGPETGYGYIRVGDNFGGPPDKGTSGDTDESGGGRWRGNGPHRVTAFVEKPDVETARAYLESGEYLWNSGILMMRVSVWISELERHRPDIEAASRAAYTGGAMDGEFFRPSSDDFLSCPKESIDYAVMNVAAGEARRAQGGASCVVVPLEVGWSDVGAWSALWDKLDHDSQGNVVQGDVYADSTRDALLIAQHRLLAAVGLEDVVVVETPDAVLVARKDRAQDVGEIVRRLEADGRSEHEDHRKVHRPWGAFETIDSGVGFQVKRLTINPGAAISLQRHSRRAEHWVVVSGIARVTRGGEEFLLHENESTYVPKDTVHRLENSGPSPLEIVEVQSGSYLGEDDIERLDDNYGRY